MALDLRRDRPAHCAMAASARPLSLPRVLDLRARPSFCCSARHRVSARVFGFAFRSASYSHFDFMLAPFLGCKWHNSPDWICNGPRYHKRPIASGSDHALPSVLPQAAWGALRQCAPCSISASAYAQATARWSRPRPISAGDR
jgi:hypothetical protein